MSRAALLVATASLATGLVAGPGVAYAADTSTELTAAEMAADLKAVSDASAKAAAQGWKATMKPLDSSSGSMFIAADPVTGRSYMRYDFGGTTAAQYFAKGQGMYSSLSDPESRAAVRMMGLPSKRYAFIADKSEEGLADEFSPGTLLSDGDHAGTKTVHDDGSVDYRLSVDGSTLTAHVTAAGTLSSADEVDRDGHTKLTYAYGPQQVTLPSAGVTISFAALARGLAYLHMESSVKQVAGEAATDTLQAAHRHPIPVSLLRAVTKDDVASFNDDIGVRVKAKNVGGGVRVYATNPWTHRTVAYTLKASGRKVVIAKD